jgi:hypothetical protein
MKVTRIFTLTLEKSDVMQVLDALTDRAEAWEKTKAVLNDEFESEDIFVPEECDDSSEAADIAQHFRDIISIIEAQLHQDNS